MENRKRKQVGDGETGGANHGKRQKIDAPTFVRNFIPEGVFRGSVVPHMTLLSTIRLGRTCKWFHALLGTARGEQRELIRRLENARQVILYVGKWGESDLIDYMLWRGQRLEKGYDDTYLAWGLASCGHQRLFRDYFDGRIDADLLVEGAMYGAARYGDGAFVEYLLASLGEGEVDNSIWFQGLLGAVKLGDPKAIDHYMGKCSELDEHHIFSVAGETGNTKTIDFLTNHPRLIAYQRKSMGICMGACKGGKLALVKEYLAATTFPAAILDELLFVAAWGRRRDVVDYLLEIQPERPVNRGFMGAVASGDEELIEFFSGLCEARGVKVDRKKVREVALKHNPTFARKYEGEMTE